MAAGDGKPVTDASAPEPIETMDGRQSQAAAEIARGTGRLLASLGLASVPELPLPNGRRADLMAIDRAGEIWIVEIKSSIEDFRADQKWPEYREYCDRLWFAVAPLFPRDVLPEATGIIVADRYGAEIVRSAPEHRLAGARRKATTLRLARIAGFRLQAGSDPEHPLEKALRGE
jgi:hypothetical protein